MTKKPAQVFHFDLYGKRDDKYEFLNENSISSIAWNTLQPQEPELFFVPKDFAVLEIYNKGFKINEIFPLNSVGIVTARDGFTIHNTEDQVKKVIEDFLILDDETARIKYELGKDVRDWQVNFAKKDLLENYPKKGKITKISYRPFDIRYTFYTGNSKGFHCYPRNEVSKHFINNNVGIVFEKIMMNKKTEFNDIFITNKIFDSHAIGSASYSFSLYLYPETTGQQTLSEFQTLTGLNGRVPNLNMEIVNEIAKKLGIPFVAETLRQAQCDKKEFTPIDILDYIYAVLHSPSYRSTYKEFLKIDFPRVPFPKNLKTFFELVNLGSQLRQIHLLESEVVEKFITQYPVDGDNVVVKPRLDLTCFEKQSGLGNVYINETQYFANVPLVAWNFYIGGYQPAQKWLKDRKDRTLSHEDIFHYQKIIVALTETDRLMKEIDGIEVYLSINI